MKIIHVTSVIGFCAFLISACASSYKNQVENSGSYVSINNGALGWSGIFLNEHLNDVQNRLGRRLSIHEQAFPSCGQYASQIVLNHRVVTLEWSELTVNPTVDSIYVDLPSNESTMTAASIADIIIQHIPRMEWMATGNDSAQLKYANGNIILIKNGSDNFLLITSAACLD